jgi:ELWxxDGT repeat protein
VLPGAHGSLPAPLTPVAGMLFFDAEDVYASMDSERELWRSDGTRWETRMVAETG